MYPRKWLIFPSKGWESTLLWSGKETYGKSKTFIYFFFSYLVYQAGTWVKLDEHITVTPLIQNQDRHPFQPLQTWWTESNHVSVFSVQKTENKKVLKTYQAGALFNANARRKKILQEFLQLRNSAYPFSFFAFFFFLFLVNLHSFKGAAIFSGSGNRHFRRNGNSQRYGHEEATVLLFVFSFLWAKELLWITSTQTSTLGVTSFRVSKICLKRSCVVRALTYREQIKHERPHRLTYSHKIATIVNKGSPTKRLPYSKTTSSLRKPYLQLKTH